MSEAWSHTQTEANRPWRRADSVKPLDLNVLPPRYRPKRPTLLTTMPWVLLILLAGLVYPANVRFLEAARAFQRVAARYEHVRDALDEYSPLIAEAEALQGQLDAEISRAAAIEAIYADVQIQQVVWSDILRRVIAAQPANLIILTIDQLDEEISLSGTADSHLSVLTLRSELRAADLFEEVEIVSITLVPPEEETPAAPADEGETVDTEGSSPAEAQRYSFELLLRLPLAAEEQGSD